MSASYSFELRNLPSTAPSDPTRNLNRGHRLAFMSPEIGEAIFAGKPPPLLTAYRPTLAEPISRHWKVQEQTLLQEHDVTAMFIHLVALEAKAA